MSSRVVYYYSNGPRRAHDIILCNNNNIFDATPSCTQTIHDVVYTPYTTIIHNKYYTSCISTSYGEAAAEVPSHLQRLRGSSEERDREKIVTNYTRFFVSRDAWRIQFIVSRKNLLLPADTRSYVYRYTFRAWLSMRSALFFGCSGTMHSKYTVRNACNSNN